MQKAYVAYYRVSTQRQQASGLGLDAQREAASRYLTTVAGDLVDEFIETESGSRKDRPELTRAIARCRSSKSILLIAKLDRLARNVHFVSGLMESGVDFVAADNPHANKLMIHLLAAFAEHEREVISERTKAALAAARCRGVALGRHGRQLAIENRQRADSLARRLRPLVLEAGPIDRLGGRKLATFLNEQGIAAPRGGLWHATTAQRLLERLREHV